MNVPRPSRAIPVAAVLVLAVGAAAARAPLLVIAEDAPHPPTPPPATGRAAVGSPACGGTNKAARCHLQLDRAPAAADERPGHYSAITSAVRFRELAIWRERGSHARAFERLSTERARTMAEQLAFWESGQAEPDAARRDPTRRADCLSCHALVPGAPGDPPASRKPEGVSCESCHGHAGDGKDEAGKRVEGWIDAHHLPGWREKPREEWDRRGMTYTKDLREWARRCLECHLGTGPRPGRNRLPHALLAAGHPPLSFELVTDLALAPHHFRERTLAGVVPRELVPWFYARLFAVGQAVTLAESMRRLERTIRERAAPDLAVMECFACHHAIDTTLAARRRAGWRQGTRGFFGEPGEPALGLESWMVARHVAKRLLPKEAFDALVRDVLAVFSAVSLRGVRDRDATAAAAARAAAAADDLAARADAAVRLDPASAKAQAKDALDLLRDVAADAEVPFYGYRAAEQQARALYVLYLVAFARSDERPAAHDKIRDRLDALFGLLYTPAREPRPSEFDLAAYQEARAAVARELPGELKRP